MVWPVNDIVNQRVATFFSSLSLFPTFALVSVILVICGRNSKLCGISKEININNSMLTTKTTKARKNDETLLLNCCEGSKETKTTHIACFVKHFPHFTGSYLYILITIRTTSAHHIINTQLQRLENRHFLPLSKLAFCLHFQNKQKIANMSSMFVFV